MNIHLKIMCESNETQPIGYIAAGTETNQRHRDVKSKQVSEELIFNPTVMLNIWAPSLHISVK